jgi:rhodanese-related sulfurtransferase
MPIASMRRAGSVKCFAEITPKRCALVSPRSARNARHLSHSGLNCRAESGSKGAGASGLAVEGLRPTSPKVCRSVFFCRVKSTTPMLVLISINKKLPPPRRGIPLQAWEIMSTSLRSSGVKLISTKELAAKLDKRGRTIVDVRPAGDYDVERIPGSVNVEFYRLIEGWDPVRIARRAVFAFFGVLNGTEYNDRFLTEFAAAVPNKRNEIVLVSGMLVLGAGKCGKILLGDVSSGVMYLNAKKQRSTLRCLLKLHCFPYFV